MQDAIHNNIPWKAYISALSSHMEQFLGYPANFKALRGSVLTWRLKKVVFSSQPHSNEQITVLPYIHIKVLQLIMDGPRFCWIWKKEDLWRVITFTWAFSGWVLVRRRSRPPWLACSCLRSHSYALPAECTEKEKHMNFGISLTRIVSMQIRNIQGHRYPN